MFTIVRNRCQTDVQGRGSAAALQTILYHYPSRIADRRYATRKAAAGKVGQGCLLSAGLSVAYH